jgi:hypothetical protein
MKRVSLTEELAYGNALDRLTGAEKTVKPPPREERVELPKTATIKLSVFLNHEEDAYLENLASTAKFSGGKKLSKTRLIEAMVRAFHTSKLDVRGVRNDAELLQRMITQLRQ